MKRVAFTDSNQSLESAPYRTVFFDRLNKIRTARRLKATVSSQQWAEANLVNADHQNYDATGQANQRGENEVHSPSLWIGRFTKRGSCLILLASR